LKKTIAQEHVINALDAYIRTLNMIPEGYKIDDLSLSGTHGTVIFKRISNED
jgi:hypothetical protein